MHLNLAINCVTAKSFLLYWTKAVFGGSWGKKSSTTGLPLGVRNETAVAGDAQRYRVTPEMDPFYRGGPTSKTVSFLGDERFAETDTRPERKPNSYNCDKPMQLQEKYFGNQHPSSGSLSAQGREAEFPARSPQPQSASRPASGDPYMNGKGPPVDRQQQQQQQQQQPVQQQTQPQQQQLAPPRRGPGGQLRPTPEGSFPPEGGPPPPRDQCYKPIYST